jgi:hypothetical protein
MRTTRTTRRAGTASGSSRSAADWPCDGIVWESDRRLSPTARRASATIVLVGLVAPACFGVLYLVGGWGEVGNPWWHAFMASLVVGLPGAAIAGPLLLQGGVRAAVTGDGRLHVHRSRRTSITDLRSFNRVTVKRQRSRGSRGAAVETIIVNGWRAGSRLAEPTPIGVLSRAEERALRDAIRTVRAAQAGQGES